jgi:succinoglycan biosynthesis protein ExoL
MQTQEIKIDEPPPPQGGVIYLAPDCTDSAVQRRARGFLAAGVDLVSFCFRRSRYNVDFVPDWANIEMGMTTERRLVPRLLVIFRAIRLIYRHRRTWRGASILCARNLDLALLAVVGKTLTRSPASLVYEVLDVHPATSVEGVHGSLLRWLERRVLSRSQLLVVSSPAFVDHYFGPVQKYQGQTFLLENKWPRAEIAGMTRSVPYELSEEAPVWTIGWFGNIRCPESLRVLTQLADALPDRVRIYIRGHASLLGEQTLQEAIRGRDNMIFDGEYCAPADLAEIYSKVHFNWCVDLCGGKNSQWLLPNRIYEGGYFGIPALAVDHHETGRLVQQRELGLTLAHPLSEALQELLQRITPDDYRKLRRGIEALPASYFVDEGDVGQLVQRMLRVDAGHERWRPALKVPHNAAEPRG